MPENVFQRGREVLERLRAWEVNAKRVGAVLFGLTYITLVGLVLAQITQSPFVLVLSLTYVGAAAIVATLVAFGVKAYHETESVRRFRLSSLMLLTVPLAIYFAAIRTALRPVLKEGVDSDAWLPFFSMSGGFIAFSTIILLLFGEAVMGLAVSVQRMIRSRRGASQAFIRR